MKVTSPPMARLRPAARGRVPEEGGLYRQEELFIEIKDHHKFFL
jgi:hypothetical protein